jgi:DNA-directed RNA polymerase II subunit RPB11
MTRQNPRRIHVLWPLSPDEDPLVPDFQIGLPDTVKSSTARLADLQGLLPSYAQESDTICVSSKHRPTQFHATYIGAAILAEMAPNHHEHTHKGMREYTPLSRNIERNPVPSAGRYPGTAEDPPGPRSHIDLQYDQVREESDPKLEEWEDDNTPDLSTFRFHKEDHTLGNLVSQRLLKYAEIMFSGYKMDTANSNFDLRVQTDGTITPRDAVVRCCQDVIKDLATFDNSFRTEYAGKRAVRDGERQKDLRADLVTGAEQPITVAAKEHESPDEFEDSGIGIDIDIPDERHE